MTAREASGCDVVKHTDSFVVKDQNGRQYTVHELTPIIETPPAVGETAKGVESGEKRYELRDSPGTIRRIDQNAFQISFPFAQTVTANLV